MTTSPPSASAFDSLLTRLGLTREYVDGTQRHRRASTEACLALARALGADIDHPEQAPRVLEELGAPRPPRVDVQWLGGPADAERPPGVHPGEQGQTWTIVAPERAPPLTHRGLCLFAPWYALWRDDDAASPQGTFAELRGAFETCADAGATLFGTLPMMPMFTDPQRYDPSPYSPVSRLFLNELLLDTAALGVRVGAPRPLSPDVDHGAYATALREALRPQTDTYDAPVDDTLAAYAAFRAVVEAGDAPEAHRSAIERGDAGPIAGQRYHRFVQTAARRQWRETLTYGAQRGVGCYLDFPLGTHGGGFDTFCRPDLYARGISVGAPPDAMFPTGQNWAFPPWRPDALEADGYQTLIQHVEATARYADVMRVDHVMGLHRCYVIPDGFSADDGCYLHYNTEAMFAAFLLAAHRQQTALIGENLGTVPDEIDARLTRHGLFGMYIDALDEHGARPPHSTEVAGLGTHDLPLFFAERPADAAGQAALGERIGHLAQSQAPLAIVDVADLLGQQVAHNVPGTTHAMRKNWRRRLPAPLPLPAARMQSVLQPFRAPD